RELKWRCGHCNCARNLDSMVYCKHCGERRTEAPSQGADAALGGGPRRRPSAPLRGALPAGNGADTAVDHNFTVDELDQLVRLAEKAGDAHAVGRYKQQLQSKRAGDPPPQQRITDIGAKQYQSWVATQLATVAELTGRLSAADAKYKEAATSLSGVQAQSRAGSQPPPAKLSIEEVVNGTGDILNLIDVDSHFNVDGYEVPDEDRKSITERRDQLYDQLQTAAKGLFSEAVAKMESIKADHAAHLARLSKKRK
ncbi:unnamed protein product, partial [Prorocentrum cordatum]